MRFDRVAGPALFVDFDNTITKGDVLDRVIEAHSPGDEWRALEARWQAGAISTHECLRAQMAGVCASIDTLRDFVAGMPLDPGFARLVEWARREGVPLQILTDNFAPLVDAILERNGLSALTVHANALAEENGTLVASFPHASEECRRCAHCKRTRVGRSAHRPRIFVGDGLSDTCGAMAADIVFAKDSLAANLAANGVAFREFDELDAVVAALEREFTPRPATAGRPR